MVRGSTLNISCNMYNIYISISSDVNCLPSVSSLYQELTFHANIYALPLLSFFWPYTLDPLISRLQVSIRLAFHKYFSNSDVCPAFILQESIESSSTENWFIFSIASSMWWTSLKSWPNSINRALVIVGWKNRLKIKKWYYRSIPERGKYPLSLNFAVRSRLQPVVWARDWSGKLKCSTWKWREKSILPVTRNRPPQANDPAVC